MAIPATWNGRLNANEIFSAIFNMIISQTVYSDNFSGHYNSLVERNRVEGARFGDTKLYYATDAIETKEFKADTVDQLNLLSVNRPKPPHVQAITMDKFRFLETTTDQYQTPRAFSDSNVFGQFNSVIIGWMSDTKKMFDNKTYNAYVGTAQTSEGKQMQTVDFSEILDPASTMDQEAKNRLIAETIAQKLSDLFVDMKDETKDYTDLANYRSYVAGDFDIIWNAKWVNMIRKLGLPSLFHKDGLLEIKEDNVLPAKYFGTVNAEQKVADEATRSLIEQTIEGVHYWPGETIATGATAPAGTSYQESPAPMTEGSIICKIIHKKGIPYMSGFVSSSEFINPKNKSTNHYMHFGHNTLQYLYNYPLITVTAEVEA